NVASSGLNGSRARVPLNLATRRPRQCSGPQQQHLVNWQVMLLGDGAADGGHHLVEIQFLVTPRDFVSNHKMDFVVGAPPEDRAAVGPKGRMALLDGRLDVLRVVVGASNNDCILQSARDEQATVLDKTQVSRAKEWAFAALGQASLENSGRFVWPVPVALRDVRSGHPVL